MPLLWKEDRLNWTLYHYDSEAEAQAYAERSPYRAYVRYDGLTYIVHEHYYQRKERQSGQPVD